MKKLLFALFAFVLLCSISHAEDDYLTPGTLEYAKAYAKTMSTVSGLNTNQKKNNK